MLVCPKFTYKHRKWNQVSCPSWGDEGWTFTPLSCVNRSVAQAPITLEDGLVRVVLPEFEDSVKSILVKVKSTLLMQRVTLLDYTLEEAVLADPDRIITEDFVGGIIAIARFCTYVPLPNRSDSFIVDLKYRPESGNIHPMAAIYYGDKPLQLDPDYLHDLNLVALDDWTVQVPTAWVDPGFQGTLFVPWMHDSVGRLTVNSYKYPGSNRYQGYSGEDRLYLNPRQPKSE